MLRCVPHDDLLMHWCNAPHGFDAKLTSLQAGIFSWECSAVNTVSHAVRLRLRKMLQASCFTLNAQVQ